jgi:hypothetical protein
MAEVGDIEAMAKYSIDLLSDDAKLQEVRRRCRVYAQSRFCATKIIPQYEAFYRAVLERNS